MIEIVNTTPNEAVVAMEKFRVTWSYFGAQYLPEIVFNDTPSDAVAIQEWLPSAGFIPVSSPSAVAGSRVILFDVRLASSAWGSAIVSDVINRLNDSPRLTEVIRIEKVGTETSSETTQNQNDAIGQGEQGIKDQGFLEQFKKLGSGIQTIVIAIAVIAVVAGAAYLYHEVK